MTPKEHQQIAEINALWRNMNKPKGSEEAMLEALSQWQANRIYLTECGSADHVNDLTFINGFTAAVAYLSEPGAMRFLANETITKENDALKAETERIKRESGEAEAAIHFLEREIDNKGDDIQNLKDENDALKAKIAELEAKYSALLIFSASPEGK